MPSILDEILSPAKILLIGKSGAGKTGALASLVTAGYNLRIIDTDKGAKTLRSLLLQPQYPYAAVIRAKGIDLSKAVRFIPIDTTMTLRSVTRKIGDKQTSETILAPKNANAWNKVIRLLDHWKEDDGTDLGPVYTWGPMDILVLDSFSTLAKCAYYFSQSLNGRLGSRDEGFDYQRDIGAAQAQLTRLLEMLYDSTISCNVIVISHVTWVDESRGYAANPKPKDGSDSVVSSPDGFPSAIGRALSPQMGKYFNDVFISLSSGSGGAVRRTISTVPQDGVIAKNSVYLEREYPIASALASIFAALRGVTPPESLSSLSSLSVPKAPGTAPKPTSSLPAPTQGPSTAAGPTT